MSQPDHDQHVGVPGSAHGIDAEGLASRIRRVRRGRRADRSCASANRTRRLFDEVEKAHPDVLELFFQVFDKGGMEDGEGREIDFKNTIIILTSNAATDQMMKLVADPETMPSPKGIVNAIKPELNKVFKPAFLGRLVIIPYYPVRDEVLKTIVRLKLGKIVRRIRRITRSNSVRADGDRNGSLALYGSGERRPQCRQHPDQYGVAGHFTNPAGQDRSG